MPRYSIVRVYLDSVCIIINSATSSTTCSDCTIAGKYSSAGYTRPNYVEGSKSGIGVKDKREIEAAARIR